MSQAFRFRYFCQDIEKQPLPKLIHALNLAADNKHVINLVSTREYEQYSINHLV
jgi:hypothetical protein